MTDLQSLSLSSNTPSTTSRTHSQLQEPAWRYFVQPTSLTAQRSNGSSSSSSSSRKGGQSRGQSPMSRKNLARYSLSDDPQQQPYRRSLRPLAMCHCNGDGQCGLYGCDESLSENNFYKRSTSEDLRRRKTTDADYVCEDHSRRPTPPPRLNHSQSKLGLAKSIASSLMQKVAKRLSVASLRSTGSFTDHTGSGGIYPNSTHVSGDESTSAGKGKHTRYGRSSFSGHHSRAAASSPDLSNNRRAFEDRSVKNSRRVSIAGPIIYAQPQDPVLQSLRHPTTSSNSSSNSSSSQGKHEPHYSARSATSHTSLDLGLLGNSNSGRRGSLASEQTSTGMRAWNYLRFRSIGKSPTPVHATGVVPSSSPLVLEEEEESCVVDRCDSPLVQGHLYSVPEHVTDQESVDHCQSDRTTTTTTSTTTGTGTTTIGTTTGTTTGTTITTTAAVTDHRIESHLHSPSKCSHQSPLPKTDLHETTPTPPTPPSPADRTRSRSMLLQEVAYDLPALPSSVETELLVLQGENQRLSMALQTEVESRKLLQLELSAAVEQIRLLGNQDRLADAYLNTKAHLTYMQSRCVSLESSRSGVSLSGNGGCVPLPPSLIVPGPWSSNHNTVKSSTPSSLLFSGGGAGGSNINSSSSSRINHNNSSSSGCDLCDGNNRRLGDSRSSTVYSDRSQNIQGSMAVTTVMQTRKNSNGFNHKQSLSNHHQATDIVSSTPITSQQQQQQLLQQQHHHHHPCKPRTGSVSSKSTSTASSDTTVYAPGTADFPEEEEEEECPGNCCYSHSLPAPTSQATLLLSEAHKTAAAAGAGRAHTQTARRRTAWHTGGLFGLSSPNVVHSCASAPLLTLPSTTVSAVVQPSITSTSTLISRLPRLTPAMLEHNSSSSGLSDNGMTGGGSVGTRTAAMTIGRHAQYSNTPCRHRSSASSSAPCKTSRSPILTLLWPTVT
ncbi:hypothetical protein BASA61_004363 [Batrachochytrium salamandrivorans]|nr:hypothetical protein BASA61_004363 [Batrachochytrium salamandrivorans]